MVDLHTGNTFLDLLKIDWDIRITGSYLVNKEAANDIDIIILNNNGVEEKLIGLGFVQTSFEGYESKAKTLKSTWRKGDFNVLVIIDRTAFALWSAFSNIIAHKNYSFTDKAERIKLADLIMSAYVKETNDT